MRSDSDGWISTVTKTASTNRVHSAVCPRQVQVDQAVRLGQEEVQVLHGKKERDFKRQSRAVVIGLIDTLSHGN